MTLSVSDPKRSLDFYQGLFGMPVQARQGQTTLLRIGAGPQFLALSGTGANGTPSINHFCMTVENFDADRAMAVLASHGVTRADGAGGGLSGGADESARPHARPGIRRRTGRTPELYFGDPDGIVVQLQDPVLRRAGVLGDVCAAAEPSPKKGLLAVRDLSHFTITATTPQRSNKFYQDLFGLDVQARQGPTAPLLGVGSGVQFLMFTGGAGGRPRCARGAAAAGEHQPCVLEHGQLQARRDPEDARELRDQAARHHAGTGRADGVVRHACAWRTAAARRKARRSCTSPIPTVC